jgi:uncharacterized integral membrane protein
MKPIKFLAIVFLLFLFTSNSFAQTTTPENDKLSLNNSTLNNQFEYVLKKSGNFKGTNGQAYEAVKRSMLLTLQAHTRDSLKTIQTKLDNSRSTVEAQQKEIKSLKSNLNGTQSTLDATNLEKNNMSLLGLQMSKTSYNVLMWAIIAGLLALLLFFIFKFKNSNSVTRNVKNALEEIEEEFDEHRKTALDREQKVRRQLQDEINKHKGQ